MLGQQYVPANPAMRRLGSCIEAALSGSLSIKIRPLTRAATALSHQMCASRAVTVTTTGLQLPILLQS
jgi:hypothetical protein